MFAGKILTMIKLKFFELGLLPFKVLEIIQLKAKLNI